MSDHKTKKKKKSKKHQKKKDKKKEEMEIEQSVVQKTPSKKKDKKKKEKKVKKEKKKAEKKKSKKKKDKSPKKSKTIPETKKESKKNKKTKKDKKKKDKKAKKEKQKKISNNNGFDLRAKPLAKDQIKIKILDLISEANSYQLVRKGANEATKMLNRSQAEFIVICADVIPLEILLHLPLLCEDKNIPFCFLPSSMALGKSCGLTRRITACAVIKSDRNPIQRKIDSLKAEMEQMLMNQD
ncbi:nhp2-like protein [Anaeramoeba flamelloides]|uniref:H/ACA ribonucleoprotein complex subunit 2 n=1 Tax=Anaeramoeba flamelloides TaxID=1746091 RepID=A0AAV7YD54_9EUKA|nr:nhp2-like protein [Anaeramoeba flamelloides]KAJ6244391.1 nhp2-like protein [Anaeramoeba flamelloides]